MVKNLPASAGVAKDTGLISGSGRSPGGGIGNPLRYSCLENFMDRRASPATVQEFAESDMTEHSAAGILWESCARKTSC